MVSERSKEKQAGGKTAVKRRERLAAELRANLKKRKMRTRAAQHDESGDTKKPG